MRISQIKIFCVSVANQRINYRELQADINNFIKNMNAFDIISIDYVIDTCSNQVKFSSLLGIVRYYVPEQGGVK